MSDSRDYEPTYHISYVVPRTGYIGSLMLNLHGQLFLPSMYHLLVGSCRDEAKKFAGRTISDDEKIVILGIYKFDMLYQTQKEKLAEKLMEK